MTTIKLTKALEQRPIPEHWVSRCCKANTYTRDGKTYCAVCDKRQEERESEQ